MPIAVGQKMRPLVAVKKPTQKTVTPRPDQRLGQQSMIKAMVSTVEISVGTIAHRRGLLDDSCLIERSFTAPPSASQPPNASQASFTATPAEGLRVQKIVESSSPKAQFFLKSMKGMEQALRDGYLHAVTIILFTDPEDRNNILESYTFEFQYSHLDGTPSLAFHSHSKTGNLNIPKDVASLQDAVRSFSKSLIEVLEDLDPLPEQRWCDIKLEYNDRAPEGYHPAGFESGSGEHVFFSTHSGLEVPVKYHVDSVQMPTYGLALSVASICPFIDHAGPRNHRWDGSGDELPDTESEAAVPNDVFAAAALGLASFDGRCGERDGNWHSEMDEDSPSTQLDDGVSSVVGDHTVRSDHILRSSNALDEPVEVPATPPPAVAKPKPKPKPKRKASVIKRAADNRLDEDRQPCLEEWRRGKEPAPFEPHRGPNRSLGVKFAFL